MAPAPEQASIATPVPLQVEADWRGVEDVFGGKVIALLADCVAAVPELDRLQVAALWVEFSSSVVPGAVDGRVEVLHAGRSTATVRAQLVQDGRSRASGMAKLVAAGSSPSLSPRDLGAVPRPEEVPDLVPPWGALAYDPKVQVKVVRTALVDGVLTTQAWVRVRPGQGADLGHVGVAAVLLDLLPPGLFHHERRPSFVPTVDFALHLDPSARPAVGEWHWGEVRTEWADGEFCGETGELRRADGTFVARGTQTRRVVW